MELTPEIRERLKTLMKTKGDTGYTLHRKLGISATTISNYLNGKIHKADNTKIKAMCDLWGVDIYWLETGIHRIEEAIEKEPIPKHPEELLKQILLKLNGKDDQYSNIRKDIYLIRDDINSIKKELVQLKTEISHPKIKIKK